MEDKDITPRLCGRRAYKPRLECFNCKYFGSFDVKLDEKIALGRLHCPNCNKIYRPKLKCQKCHFHGFFENRDITELLKNYERLFNEEQYVTIAAEFCPECKTRYIVS